MSSDCDSKSNSVINGDNPDTPPRKKQATWYKQPFNEEWLQIEEFKEWLKPEPGNKYASKCTVCDTKLLGVNKSALMKHAQTSKHEKNFKVKQSSLNIKTFMAKPSVTSIQCKVAKAEIALTAFVAEHNVPFRHMDHLINCVKSAFPDSQIAQKLTLKRTKSSYLLQDGLAHNQRENIVSKCKERKFSVLIDESTDISVSQILAVVVRFFDEQSSTVVDALFDLVEVENGTAGGLYKSFKDLMMSNNIPLANIIGFASDNCATMMGQHNGFQVLLKADVPDVFVIGCICHSIALCANEASQCLPSWLEAFVKDVCFYFSRSSKRNHAFSMIQDIVAMQNKHRILKLCATRWLSHGLVVERILEQWDALELYFMSEAQTNKVDNASRIYDVIKTTGTKHMMLFLCYVLKKVNTMNLEFQSQQCRLHTVFGTISDEYRSLLAMFIRPEIIAEKALADIDPFDTSAHKAMSDIEVGGRCESLLAQQPLGAKEAIFKKDALTFLTVLCSQIVKRFPLSNKSVLCLLRLLDPVQALGTQQSASTNYVRPSIIPLAAHFPNLVPEDMLDTLQNQWRSLYFAKEAFGHIAHYDLPNFWIAVGAVTDGNDQRKFGILSDFMCNLLSLPHSSACVERIFSQVNVIKTKQANKLKCRTVADRILAKQAIAQKNQECHSWIPPNTLVEDVIEGRCHARYIRRQEQQQESNAITIVVGIESDSDTD
jgi:Domain of unknown function (DUF4371)